MEDNGGAFYSTYGWHPRSVAAAIGTLRSLKVNRVRLLADVAEMSEYFRVRLLQLESDRPAAIRIQGLAIGIDVSDEDYADHPRQVPSQWAARLDRRIDGAVVAVAGNRQADRRKRTGHSGALDMMRHGGVAPSLDTGALFGAVPWLPVGRGVWRRHDVEEVREREGVPHI